MREIKSVAFTVRQSDNIWESTRSSIGLGIENLDFALFIIDAPILPDGREEEFLDNFEMINDIEGKTYTSVKEDAERFEFIDYMSLEEMGTELKKFDLISTF